MKQIRNQKGYTLAEVLTVTGLMGVVTAVMLSMMLSSAKSFDGTTTKSYTDSDAVIAMQMIVSDVREAKSVKILASGERLRVVFPVRTDDDYYDRHIPDTQGQLDYYISDDTGTPGHEGTWLWKGKSDGTRQVLLKRNVKSLSFEQDTTRSVKITIIAEHNSAGGPVETELTQRVVYLRNY